MKKCPKCGASMPDDSNFCTECGEKLTDVTNCKNDELSSDTTEQNKYSTGAEHMKQTFINYFHWIVNSWMHPTEIEKPVSKWFGIVSIVVEILLFSISFFECTKNLISSINSFAGNTVNSLASIFGSQLQNIGQLINFDPFSISLKLFIMLIILSLVIFGAVYGIHCWIFKQRENFFDFINRFAHYTNVILIINALLCVVGLISNSYTLMIILLFLSLCFYILGMTSIIIVYQEPQRFDRFYGAIMVLLVIFIITVILIRIGGAEVISIIKAFFGLSM